MLDEGEKHRLWRLEEIADAARSLPFDQQSERLQQALARLIEVPRPAPKPADPPAPR